LVLNIIQNIPTNLGENFYLKAMW